MKKITLLIVGIFIVNTLAMAVPINISNYYTNLKFNAMTRTGAGLPTAYLSNEKLPYNPPQIFLQPSPTLISPSNNSTNMTITQQLQWGTVAGALSYRYQIAIDSNFNNIVSNVVETTNNVTVGGLSNSTQYFWRVCAKDATDSTDWSNVWSFITQATPGRITIGAGTDYDISQPYDRYYAYNTHEAIYYQTDLGNAKAITSIGYYKGQGTSNNQVLNVSIYMKHTTLIEFTSGPYTLAGYTLVYQGAVPNNLPSGWFDVNLTSPFSYNGTNNLQVLIIKAYQSPIDYFDAPAWRFTFGTYNAQRSASSNTSQPINLDALPFIPDVRFGFATVSPSQNFTLNAGWNMISANVEPISNSTVSIMAPLSGNLQQMKNVYGQIYAPPFTNSLSTWNKYHAYQVRLTTAAQFQITGAPIVPETTPITLNQLGWYWLPYYRTTQMPTATALASISGKYLQIKSITGEVYQPPFATSLANLDPNKGYMIRMTATDGTLTYPANTIIKASSDNAVLANPKVFVRENKVTGKTAFIALDLNANDGDEVGVFTRDGMLVGSSVWQNGMRGVVVWGDDEFTNEKDGASEGEELTVKVWNAESKNIGGVSQIVLSDMTTNAKEYTLRYETDGVYFLKGAVEAESTTLTVTPQPATTEVMINLGKASESGVEVRLFNQAGKMMLEARENASNGVIKLNTSEMPSGVYQAMISIDGKVQTARVVIVK